LRRHPLPVAARMRAEDHAATGPLRSAAAPLAGATGALLSPGPVAATPDLPAGAGVGGTEPASGELPDDGLVDERFVDRRGEEHRGRLGRAARLAVRGEERRRGSRGLGHRHFALCTSSRPFRAPGTAPLTRMRLRSGSAFTTLSFFTVTR